MGESSVSKAGNVSFQIKGLLKSSWQPRFLVLYNGSSDSHPHIDVYESQEKFKETKEASRKCDKQIDLNRVKSVNKSTQKSSGGMVHIIEIQCKKEKHVFSLDSEFEFNEWDYKLNKVISVLPEKGAENSSRSDTGDTEEVVTRNLMYEETSEAVRFEVTVQEDKLALLCDIVGKHILNVSERELAFEEVGTRRIKYSFHFAWLRKFGKKQDTFFFECGRKCPNGEGVISCVANDASKLHDVVTSNSQASLKKAAIPDRSNSLPAQQQNISAPVQKQSKSCMLPSDVNNDEIGAPSLATNAVRRHPATGKQPELIPIKRQTSASVSPPIPKRIPDHKSSANNSKQDSVKKHGPVSNEFTKELENKIFTHPPAEDAVKQAKNEDKPQRDLRKSRDKKKSEKEDKKSKENRKSLRDSKKDKEEKSKGFFSFGSKKKDKEEKAKPISQNQNLYEDPDAYKEKPKEKVQNSNDIYDEAISPATNVSISEPVEYAHPYVKKAIKKTKPNDTAMYSDVQDVQDRAWVTRGQEEEIHEEDYLNIKDARKEIEEQGGQNKPPPLPQKLYDLSDETYNTLDLGNKPNKDNSDTQNLYGTAGAKPVGKINIVPVPERPSLSGSEGSSGDLYEGSAEEEEHDYDLGEYEDTVLSTQNTTPKRAPQSQRINIGMYEEIPSPPPSKPAAKKNDFAPESLYDEVS